MGGASAVAAVQCAIAVIVSGVCRHVLIPLGRNGASGSRIGARVREMPQFRVVGEFEMPVGAIAPAQLTRRWPAVTWSSTGPPVASSARSPWRPAGRGAPRQRHHDRAHDARGPSGLADDRRPPPAVRLQPRERRRRRDRRQRGGARPGPGAAACLRDGRRRGPSDSPSVISQRPTSLPRPRQGGAARVRVAGGSGLATSTSPRSTLLHLHRALRDRGPRFLPKGEGGPSSRAGRRRWAAGCRSTRTADSCPRRTWRA